MSSSGRDPIFGAGVNYDVASQVGFEGGERLHDGQILARRAVAQPAAQQPVGRERVGMQEQPLQQQLQQEQQPADPGRITVEQLLGRAVVLPESLEL